MARYSAGSQKPQLRILDWMVPVILFSAVLTSNKGFEDWGAILGDAVMAAALIDQIMHHCPVVNIRGNSYRMREHTNLWQAIQPGYEELPA